MARASNCIHRNGPFRLAAKTLSHCSSGKSVMLPTGPSYRARAIQLRSSGMFGPRLLRLVSAQHITSAVAPFSSLERRIGAKRWNRQLTTTKLSRRTRIEQMEGE